MRLPIARRAGLLLTIATLTGCFSYGLTTPAKEQTAKDWALFAGAEVAIIGVTTVTLWGASEQADDDPRSFRESLVIGTALVVVGDLIAAIYLFGRDDD